MSLPTPIGFFQFDNLLRNRIPFLLLKQASADVESMFGPMERSHVRNFSLPLEQMDLPAAQAALADRQAQKDSPVVVLCENGKASLALAQKLSEQGYLNVYYVLEGLRGLNSSEN